MSDTAADLEASLDELTEAELRGMACLFVERAGMAVLEGEYRYADAWMTAGILLAEARDRKVTSAKELERMTRYGRVVRATGPSGTFEPDEQGRLQRVN